MWVRSLKLNPYSYSFETPPLNMTYNIGRSSTLKNKAYGIQGGMVEPKVQPNHLRLSSVYSSPSSTMVCATRPSNSLISRVLKNFVMIIKIKLNEPSLSPHVKHAFSMVGLHIV